MQKLIAISPAQAGTRLDRILGEFYPALGLRGRRRLIPQILVNGQKAHPGYRPVAGDTVLLPELDSSLPPSLEPALLLHASGDYNFFFKPAGLDTCSLAGKAGDTLEARIVKFGAPGELLQRLDRNTCGIVAQAKNEDAAARFRQMEKTGLCRKFYLALVDGVLEKPVTASWMLRVADRKKTGIRKDQASPERWTWFIPLPELESPRPGTSWAACSIKRGSRHQIRAHAAALGIPLAGDRLYGGGSGEFCLRHFFLSFPGAECLDLEERNGAFPLPEGSREVLAALVNSALP